MGFFTMKKSFTSLDAFLSCSVLVAMEVSACLKRLEMSTSWSKAV
jgi:hypothetical protein